MNVKKVIKGVMFGIIALILIAGIILICLFTPVKGKHNDTEYWSEYDTFSIDSYTKVEKKNEEFKILQLTDLHYHLPHKTKETDDIVKELVSSNSPDMIVITGDSVFGPTNMAYTKHLIKLMDSLQIPWALVFGNHDEEGKADKYWLAEQLSNTQYGLFQNGPYNIGGLGNYGVHITENGKILTSVILMDSNSVTQYNGEEEYGSFTPSQVMWYQWYAKGLQKANVNNSIMFCHIPFPEFSDAYEYWEASNFDPSIGAGAKFEGVCAAPYNPGIFNKIKEIGNTSHVFVGHDHANNYSVNYQGVTLSYSTKSSRQFSFVDGQIGGTLITIQNDGKINIQHKLVSL